MRPDNIDKLKSLVKVEERYKQFGYVDTTGNLTVGYGRNLSTRGVTIQEANLLLENDIPYFLDALEKALDFFADLDDIRQMVLVDMCFNLGVKGLLGFDKMLGYLANKDYVNAAYEMEHSKWDGQVKTRADTLIHMMQTGEFPE